MKIFANNLLLYIHFQKNRPVYLDHQTLSQKYPFLNRIVKEYQTAKRKP
tara:strand:+ start:289 stop:435 length:147 start_codon:yes stop_codon:yes gene_type:complete